MFIPLCCVIQLKALNEDSRQLTYLLPLVYSKASKFRNSRYGLKYQQSIGEVPFIWS